uniref:aminotransferase-like domain-containing protein n=1 Tax=Streptomyces prasinopilosus TaxID=67344 RepID=UPI0006E405B9
RAVRGAPWRRRSRGRRGGRPELRAALAEYLARVRGVRADPEHVVVCSGFAHGLRLLCDVLRTARGARTLAVEPYGLPEHRNLIERTGLRTTPVPSDAADPGDAAAVLLNPAHQFPLGGVLRPERRAAVVDWARRTGGLVLEDDYDGEFRYDRQPVGALQDLDPDHVVHLGTVSKSLAPGLRLGWMVLPPSLLPAVVEHGAARTVSVLEQLTFAEFLTSGAHDRHVRAARLRYRRRRDALVGALAARAPDVRVTGIAAGLHAVLRLPPGTERSVVRAAAWQGLSVLGLAHFRHPAAGAPPPDALVVGYGTPPDHAWAAALDALCRALP